MIKLKNFNEFINEDLGLPLDEWKLRNKTNKRKKLLKIKDKPFNKKPNNLLENNINNDTFDEKYKELEKF